MYKHGKIYFILAKYLPIFPLLNNGLPLKLHKATALVLCGNIVNKLSFYCRNNLQNPS